MRSVITVGSKKLYTNMPVKKISKKLIEFEDGSTYDVETEEITILGDGYINSTGHPQSEPKVFWGKATFPVRELVLESLELHDVEIEVWDGTTVEVSANLDSAVLSLLVASLVGDKLVVKSSYEAPVVTTTIEGSAFTGFGSINAKRIIAGGSITMLNGVLQTDDETIIVDKEPDEAVGKVLIKVPLHTSISLNGTQKSALVGDTQGPVFVNSSGHTKVSIGDVGGVALNVSDHVDVSIKTVQAVLTGSLASHAEVKIASFLGKLISVMVNSHGEFKVRSGSCDRVVIEAKSHAEVSLNIEVKNAELEAFSHSVVLVRNVTNLTKRYKDRHATLMVNGVEY